MLKLMIKSKIIVSICAGALLGSTLLVPVSSAFAEGTWQQGGLTTNNVSSSTAKTQQNISMALNIYGAVMNAAAALVAWFPITIPGLIFCKIPNPPYIFLCLTPLMSGYTGWGFNTDFMGIALDAMLLHDAMNKKAVWSEDPKDLQAQVRQIGSKEDLEGECEGEEEECNETSATLDGTEVHIQALKNVGLEALEDVAGSILITITELIGAGPTIQEGFGTELAGIDVSQSAGVKMSDGTIISYHSLGAQNNGSNNNTNNGTNNNNTNNNGTNNNGTNNNNTNNNGTNNNGTNNNTTNNNGTNNNTTNNNGNGTTNTTNTNASTATIQTANGTVSLASLQNSAAATKKDRTDQELKDISDRKLAHLQLTGTAGVARADLAAVVARSEKDAFDRLSSYVGSGNGLIANIKVLAGLDLTLAQRINLLNMLQGQQVANEAAMALQFVETE